MVRLDDDVQEGTWNDQLLFFGGEEPPRVSPLSTRQNHYLSTSTTT